MNDFTTMMRDQARSGLQAKLAEAVTNGDTEAATKVTADLEKLAVATAPKPPAFTNDDIKSELDKQPWFGIDPRRSAKAVELGKTMDPKKFPTAAAFATALVKAVDEEFKPAGNKEADDEGADDEGEEDEKPEGEEDEPKPKKAAARRTDAPSDSDAGPRTARRTSGPWTKLADAPADIQKEIRRSADRFVPANAKKETRDGFITRALESHYATHQRNRKK